MKVEEYMEKKENVDTVEVKSPADQAIDAVLKGATAKDVIRTYNSQRQLGHVFVKGKCDKEGCDYTEPVDNKNLVQKTCERCKKRIYVDPSGEQRPLKLAYLRPRQEFVFVDDKSEELFMIKPSHVGYLAFSPVDEQDNETIIEMEDALNYQIDLRTAGGADSSSFKFCEGDRVFDTIKTKKGTVVRREKGGYKISYDDGESSLTNPRSIRLIDKETTTSNYITRNNNDEWVVKFVFDTIIQPSLGSALLLLYHRRRTAFRRYSIYLFKTKHLHEYIDEEALTFLKDYDPKIWADYDNS